MFLLYKEGRSKRRSKTPIKQDDDQEQEEKEENTKNAELFDQSEPSKHHQQNSGTLIGVYESKFKTWPAKSTSLDITSSYRNLNQLAGMVEPLSSSPAASTSVTTTSAGKKQPVMLKSRTNSFESAKDELTSVIGEESRLATVDEDNVGR